MDNFANDMEMPMTDQDVSLFSVMFKEYRRIKSYSVTLMMFKNAGLTIAFYTIIFLFIIMVLPGMLTSLCITMAIGVVGLAVLLVTIPLLKDSAFDKVNIPEWQKRYLGIVGRKFFSIRVEYYVERLNKLQIYCKNEDFKRMYLLADGLLSFEEGGGTVYLDFVKFIITFCIGYVAALYVESVISPRIVLLFNVKGADPVINKAISAYIVCMTLALSFYAYPIIENIVSRSQRLKEFKLVMLILYYREVHG
jgi:hypothetical protein